MTAVLTQEERRQHQYGGAAAQAFCRRLGLTDTEIRCLMRDPERIRHLRDCINNDNTVSSQAAEVLFGHNFVGIADGCSLGFEFNNHDAVYLSEVALPSGMSSGFCQTHLLVAVPACSLVDMSRRATAVRESREPIYYGDRRPHDDDAIIATEDFAIKAAGAEWWLLRVAPVANSAISAEEVAVPAYVAYYAYWACAERRRFHLVPQRSIGYCKEHLRDGRKVALHGFNTFPIFTFLFSNEEHENVLGTIVGRQLTRRP